MHPFASYILRTYYRETGWNEDNLYANLTRSSNAILDFTPPRGLTLSISKSPNSLFRTSYSMNAMPSLNGSVGYIFTSCDLDVKTSRDVRFKDMIDHFKVYDQPRRPDARQEVWLRGERVDTRDYLLYGRLYLPTGRLDALYSTRISPTLQALVAAISDRPANVPSTSRSHNENLSNVMLSLQHDVGKWCTEYTWSAEDSMWGVRVLHNFGKLGTSTVNPDDIQRGAALPQRIGEEEFVNQGLQGRVSAGAELYFSAKEKSAGVSTGIRFTTLPDATPPSFQVPPPASSPLAMSSRGPPSQPPTTITALFNPMMGHISGAYSARVSRDLSLASRFDFNVYSYDSQWTVGAEWWLRPSRAIPSTDSRNQDPNLTKSVQHLLEGVNGVVKIRASTNSDVSLMWEGRLRHILVSLGVISDLSSSSPTPVKALGLELSYFSRG